MARAWEVWRGTGQGLSAWQQGARTPSAGPFRAILLDPPRDALRQAIAGRFAAMLTAGALEEVRALLALGLDPALPAMRGTHLGETKLPASMADRPVTDSASISATRACTDTACASFCSPSRGPTSTILT